MPAVLAAALLLSTPSPERERVIWTVIYNRCSRQSDIWFKDGDYPAIINTLRFQTELFPADYETATSLGWMLENVQKNDEATVVYQRYAKRNPTDPDATLPEVQQRFLKKDYEAVIKIGAKALNDRAHPNLFRMVANANERLSRFEESKKVWQRYLKLHPDDQRAIANLKRVTEKAGSKP